MEEMTPRRMDAGAVYEGAAARLEFNEAHFEMDCMNEVDKDGRVEDNVMMFNSDMEGTKLKGQNESFS